MYAGVPSTLPACVAASASRGRPDLGPERASSGSRPPAGRRRRLARTLASPQSMTWTSPNAPTMTFAGFRSRWMTPWAWAYPTAWQTCSNTATNRPRSAAGSGRSREQVVQGAALDQLHGQERPAVGQGADLVDRRDAGVLELAGDPGLVEEPAGGGRVGREPAGGL